MTERDLVNNAFNVLQEEFKSHIRLTGTELDAELYQEMMAAVYHAEHHIGKVILQSRFRTTVPFSSSITLKVPIVEIVSVEVDGKEVTDYSLNGRILSFVGTGTSMTVTYIAGYEIIPYDMKVAIFMHAATMFNNPTDTVETLTKASQNMLRPYRSWGLDDGEQD